VNEVKKVVLAYSGGLDTSVIVRWLIETYRCEVVCFAADVGQKEELSGLREKAIKTGAAKISGKSSPGISFSRPSGRMRFMRGPIFWGPLLRGR
jgi:hypothetical protein